LATQTPGHFMAFDLLAPWAITDYMERPFAEGAGAALEVALAQRGLIPST